MLELALFNDQAFHGVPLAIETPPVTAHEAQFDASIDPGFALC